MPIGSNSLVPRDAKVPRDDKQSKALVPRGTKKPLLHESTSRALVLREAAWGKGELATTRKISGQDKLRLLAGEMMSSAVRAPFCMEELLKMAQSQLGVHLDEIVNLKDPEFFCDDILATISSRIESVPDKNGKRNPPLHDPAWVASVVGTRVHNVYTLAGSWRIIRNTLKDLEATGLDDTDVRGQLRDNARMRAQYLVLYDTVTTVARLGQQRVANSAAATPHYAPYFVRKDKGGGGEPDMEFDQRGNNRRKIREAHKSYIDAIILELVLPDSQYPPYVLMSCLRTAVDECRKEEKRFTQALWDAIGDLSVTIQVLDLLESPLLGVEGDAWFQDNVHLSKQFTQFLTAQASSARACTMVDSWKVFLRPPLMETKKPHVLAQLWDRINMSYRQVSGVGIDTLWSLQSDLDREPQWSTYYNTGLADDEDSDLDSRALTLHKNANRNNKPPTGSAKKQIARVEADSDSDEMPGLMSVSDTDDEGEDDAYSAADDLSEGDSESDYDPEEDEWLQDMLQDALNAVIDMDDLPDFTPDVDEDNGSDNPFKRMFSRFKDRVFSANPTLKANAQSRRPFKPRPGPVPPPSARTAQAANLKDSRHPPSEPTSPQHVKADGFARPPPGSSRATKPPHTKASGKSVALPLESEEELPPLVSPSGVAPQTSYKTTMEEVEDEDNLDESKKKKKKKKKKKARKSQDVSALPSTSPPSQSSAPSKSPSKGVKESPAKSSPVKTSVRSSMDTLETNLSGTSLPLAPETFAQSARSYLRAENLPTEKKTKVKSRPAFAGGIFKPDKESKKSKSGEAKDNKGLFGKMMNLHLKKRARDLFNRLFGPADDKKPMRWDDFVKFMCDMGFSYIPSTAGSSVRFDPPDPSDPPITFHRPHPVSTLERHHLRNFAKKLHKTYGWSLELFRAVVREDEL